MRLHTDFSQAYAMMNDLEKKEFPFSASLAMNRTMSKMNKEFMPKAMDKYIDKGANPYTKKGFFTAMSRKDRLHVALGIKDKNDYLDLVIFGGQVKPLQDNQFLIQPVNQRLNKYGNIPRNTLRNKSQKDNLYFTGKPRGTNRPYGLYRRYKKKKPELVINYSNKSRQQKGFFPAGREAARYYRKNFPKIFEIAFRNTLMQSRYRPATGF